MFAAWRGHEEGVGLEVNKSNQLCTSAPLPCHPQSRGSLVGKLETTHKAWEWVAVQAGPGQQESPQAWGRAGTVQWTLVPQGR